MPQLRVSDPGPVGIVNRHYQDHSGAEDYHPGNPSRSLVLEADPVQLLLADKRSPATRRAYAGDLRHFFGADPDPPTVRAFVSLSAPEIALRLSTYKGELLAAGAAEATVNRRLSAIRSLLKFCHRLGFAQSDGRGLVDNERSRGYRDTRGIDAGQLRRLLKLPGTQDLAGLRDTALLRLLAENAFRRGEVWKLDVEDFRPGEKRLLVLGKGRGTEKEPITLSAVTVRAIEAYLGEAGHREGPLFCNLDRRPDSRGGRLSPDGLYKLVRRYGARIGVPQLSPHRIRHSAITAALEATGGDVRKVQQLSRHKKLETVTIYDDHRKDHQGQVTGILSELLGG
jgi:integrase/recombinase XerC